MKKIILILILFCAVTAQAQYYGTSRANKAYMTYLYADTVMSNIIFDKIVQMDSTLNAKMPYGMFTDTTTQTVESTSGRYGISFSNNESSYKITHTAGDSVFTIQEDGIYFITLSVIVEITSGINNHIDVWLYANGSDVPRSNTQLEIPTASIEMTLSVSFVYSFRAEEYFVIMYRGDDTDVQLAYVTAQTSPTIPISPSAKLTIHKIGAR